MKYRPNYRHAFEQKCFRLIVEAYQLVLIEKVMQLDWYENDISFELYEKMEKSPNRTKFKVHLAPEFRLPKNTVKLKGFADKLPRIDLKMAQFSSSQELKYYFEAKRLKQTDSGLKREYIKEGIDRFASEKYPLGCMLGYVLQGDVSKTLQGINSLLKKDGRDTEILNSVPNDLHELYYESTHAQIGVLKHLVFDFTTTSDL